MHSIFFRFMLHKNPKSNDDWWIIKYFRSKNLLNIKSSNMRFQVKERPLRYRVLRKLHFLDWMQKTFAVAAIGESRHCRMQHYSMSESASSESTRTRKDAERTRLITCIWAYRWSIYHTSMSDGIRDEKTIQPTGQNMWIVNY